MTAAIVTPMATDEVSTVRRTPQYSGSWPSAYLSSAPENTAGRGVGVLFLLGVALLATLLVIGLLA